LAEPRELPGGCDFDAEARRPGEDKIIFTAETPRCREEANKTARGLADGPDLWVWF
jgi:hypothetical protein